MTRLMSRKSRYSAVRRGKTSKRTIKELHGSRKNMNTTNIENSKNGRISLLLSKPLPSAKRKFETHQEYNKQFLNKDLSSTHQELHEEL